MEETEEKVEIENKRAEGEGGREREWVRKGG